MEKDEVINEGVVDAMNEGVVNSTSSIIPKIIVGAIIAVASVGGVILYKKIKNKKQEEVSTEYVETKYEVVDKNEE